MVFIKHEIFLYIEESYIDFAMDIRAFKSFHLSLLFGERKILDFEEVELFSNEPRFYSCVVITIYPVVWLKPRRKIK